jgi:predicted nucleic acid-binding protein
VALDEACRKGFNKKEVISKLQIYLDTLVIVKDISADTRVEAKRLENTCSLIHHGDSLITAFSIKHSSTLVTYDKDLIKGCTIFGIPTLDPNMMIGGSLV